MGERRGQHFLYLDGMRGVAALFVALIHASQILTGEYVKLPNGHLAVDFFFCLSGFVVAYAYADKLAGDMTRADFLLRRFIRLGPMLALALLLGAVVTLIGAALFGSRQDVHAAGIESLFSLLLLPGGFIYGNVAYPTNNPVWSLFFEICANIAFCVLTIRGRTNSLILTAALAVLLAMTAWHFHSIMFLGFAHPDFFLGGFARVAFPFAAGTMIYRLGLYRNRSAIWSWAAFLTVPLVLGFPVGSWKSDLPVIVILIPLLVVAGTAPAQAAVAPYLKFLGELSYPFYVIHEPILRALAQVKPIKTLGMLHPFMGIAITVVFSAGVALLVSRLFDLPVRRYLAARFRGRRVENSAIPNVSAAPAQSRRAQQVP